MSSNSKTLLVGAAADSHVFSLDPELRYRSFSPAHAAAMKSMYGVEIFLGERFADYQTVRADRETALANLTRALAGECVVASAYSGKPGCQRYVEVVHEPLKDATGKVVGVNVRAFDATERRATEKTLLATERRYQDRFNGAIEGMYQSSPDGRVLEANSAFAEMLGYGSAAELVTELVDVAHQVWADPDERPRFTEMLRERGTLHG